MNAQQTPCVQCGQWVWINPATGTGACGACGRVAAAVPGAMPAAGPAVMAAPAGQPPMPGAPMTPPMPGPAMPAQQLGYTRKGPEPTAPASPGAYGLPKKKVAAAIVGAIGVAVLGIGGTVLKGKKHKTGKGAASYASLEVAPERATADDLIDAAGGIAGHWRKDAAWWAANFHGVRPDGTIDLTSGGTAQVTYISPSRVQSKAKSKRRDSVKKFSFGAARVDYKRTWDVRKAWENVQVPGTPACGVRDLAASLGRKGFDSGVLHVSFDPANAFAAGGQYAWRVGSEEHAELAGWYSMVDCSLIRQQALK